MDKPLSNKEYEIAELMKPKIDALPIGNANDERTYLALETVLDKIANRRRGIESGVMVLHEPNYDPIAAASYTTLGGRRGANYLWLNNLGVRKNYAGQGYGSFLLDKLIKGGRQGTLDDKGTVMKEFGRHSLKGAKKFYEKHGMLLIDPSTDEYYMSLRNGGNIPSFGIGNATSRSWPSLAKNQFAREQFARSVIGNDVEHLMIQNINVPGGLFSVGTRNQVKLTPEMLQIIEGSVGIHNHPNETPLSPNDIVTAMAYNMQRLSSITPSGAIATINRPEKFGWRMNVNWNNLRDKMQGVYSWAGLRDKGFDDIVNKQNEILYKSKLGKDLITTSDLRGDPGFAQGGNIEYSNDVFEKLIFGQHNRDTGDITIFPEMIKQYVQRKGLDNAAYQRILKGTKLHELTHANKKLNKAFSNVGVPKELQKAFPQLSGAKAGSSNYNREFLAHFMQGKHKNYLQHTVNNLHLLKDTGYIKDFDRETIRNVLRATKHVRSIKPFARGGMVMNPIRVSRHEALLKSWSPDANKLNLAGRDGSISPSELTGVNLGNVIDSTIGMFGDGNDRDKSKWDDIIIDAGQSNIGGVINGTATDFLTKLSGGGIPIMPTPPRFMSGGGIKGFAGGNPTDTVKGLTPRDFAKNSPTAREDVIQAVLGSFTGGASELQDFELSLRLQFKQFLKSFKQVVTTQQEFEQRFKAFLQTTPLRGLYTYDPISHTSITERNVIIDENDKPILKDHHMEDVLTAANEHIPVGKFTWHDASSKDDIKYLAERFSGNYDELSQDDDFEKAVKEQFEDLFDEYKTEREK